MRPLAHFSLLSLIFATLFFAPFSVAEKVARHTPITTDSSVPKYTDHQIKDQVNSSLDRFEDFHALFLKAPTGQHREFFIEELVGTYFGHISPDDQDFFTERLKKYSLAPIKREGQTIRILNKGDLRERNSLVVDLSQAPFGKLKIKNKTFSWDQNKSLKWNYKNKLQKEINKELIGFLPQKNFLQKAWELFSPPANAFGSRPPEETGPKENIFLGVTGIAQYCIDPTKLVRSVASAACTGICAACGLEVKDNKFVKGKGGFKAGAKAFLHEAPLSGEVIRFRHGFKGLKSSSKK